MNSHVAIKYEKICLSNEMFVFKPVGIIEGNYDSEIELFETNYGEVCWSITGIYLEEDSYFGFPIEKDKLYSSNPEKSEEEILANYFYNQKEFYTLGLYNDEIGRIKVITIAAQDINCVFNEDVILEEQEKNNYETNFIDIPNEEQELPNFETDYLEIPKEEPQKSKDYSRKIVLDKEKSKRITLLELRKEVKDVIKGQDKAVDDVTRAFIINQNSINPRHKSHILIIGPSGTGKTEMMNIISNKLDLPYFKADASAYTKEGYVGKSVHSMLAGLINAANGDIKKAEHGILIVDEIDKKLTNSKDDKVSGVDVLYSMLKMMDRDVIELEIGNGYSDKQVLFDTSNLTIVFMGAFVDLYKQKEEEQKQKEEEQKQKEEENKKKIGFSFDDIQNKESKSKKEKTSKEKENKIVLTNDDLIKAGMPAEFLGRIPVITNTEDLSIENLVEILYKSKGSTIDEEKEFCSGIGISLKFTSGYMKEIAKQAKATKTGARNLRKLVRESLAPAYDEILSGKDVKVLKLTKQTALNNKKYYME